MRSKIHRWATEGLLLIALIVLVPPVAGATGNSKKLEGVRAKLFAGEEVSFAWESPETKREIPASWIQDAIARRVRINITDAVITGTLTLQYAVSEQEFALRNCIIKGPADFSYAVFKRKLILTDCTFENGANFESTTLESDTFFDSARFVAGLANFNAANFRKLASLIQCRFDSEARFENAHFSSSADFRGTAFQKAVYFNRTVIDGAGFFGHATFQEKADCIDLHIAGTVDFVGAVFKSDAIFNAVRIDQYAYFGATFEGRAIFTGIQIGSMANFQGAIFKRDVGFNSARIGLHAVFGWTPDRVGAPAIFEGEADFISLLIGAQANFVGVVFKKKANFNGGRFGQDAVFRSEDGGKVPAAVFEEEANFLGARFAEGADFRGVIFKGAAFFDRAEFNALARLGAAHFNKEVSFNNSRFAGLARFDDTVFRGRANFQGTSFRVIEFSPERRTDNQDQFHGGLDLRGCTYESIQANWPMMMKHLEPYNRQPFIQLEKVLRVAGDDHEADEVYLERQRIERLRKWQNREYEGWLASAAYGLLANYGVRPFRLIGVSIALLVLGTIFFCQRGTVSAQDEGEKSGPAHLSVTEAFAVSLHNFLPVTVPMGSRWKPRQEPVDLKIPLTKGNSVIRIRPATFATFVLRIAGWILVPLGVAALTGLLRVSP